MNFEKAEEIADAVLYEGYMLYPYRASALKNRFRWQFGVVAPRQYSMADGCEPWFTQTECLAEIGQRSALTIKLRFLQVQARTIQVPSDSTGDTWRDTVSTTVAGDDLTTWDEAVERAVVMEVPALAAGALEFPLEVAGGRDEDLRYESTGRLAARVIRERWPISGRLLVTVEAGDTFSKIRVRVENTTAWDGVAERSIVLRHSLVGTHTLLAIADGRFVSLQDPPDAAEALAKSCVNIGSWPALAGSPGARDVMLASPIILTDYPAVAPESTGNLFDATEIDELLTLRVMTLTAGEKREARATDDRTRRMFERTDFMPADALRRLHGSIRDVDPGTPAVPDGNDAPRTNQQEWEELLNPPTTAAPECATLDIPGARIRAGSRVRLDPQRRADPIDMFLAGRIATVAGVYRTLENEAYVAVTIDGDPGADLRHATGRYFYFSSGEINALEPDEGH